MRIRTASDGIYTLIAWLPLIGIALGVGWLLVTGMTALEARSYGTEWFISNDATDNRLERIGGPDAVDHEAALQQAYESGDVAQMERALGAYEQDASAQAAAVGR